MPTVTVNPIPSIICAPNRAQTISGSRSTNTIISIRGAVTEVIRYPSSTTWEADIYIFGSQQQIIQIIATDDTLEEASIRSPIIYQDNPPLFSVKSISPSTTYSKAILEGYKQPNSSIEVSHNEGLWTTIVPSSPYYDWKYLLDLVSGPNIIKLRARDDICGNVSSVFTVSTTYTNPLQIGGSFLINNGNEITASQQVVLSFNSSTATTIEISNYSDFREVKIIPYQPKILWGLLPVPGLSYVYIKYKNAQQTSSVIAQNIILTSSLIEEIYQNPEHQLLYVDLTDHITHTRYYPSVKIVDNRDGTFTIHIYKDITAVLAGAPLLAVATTSSTGEQVLPITDLGTGIALLTGTVTCIISAGSQDVYLQYKSDAFDPRTGESIIPLHYTITQDIKYFYASLMLPHFESKYTGTILALVHSDESLQSTTFAVQKTFSLIPQVATGYGYGYGAPFLSQAFDDSKIYSPTDFSKNVATYPLTGMRFWYPTLPDYAQVTSIEELPDRFIITINKYVSLFDPHFGCRLEFTRQDKKYTDYRIRKHDGVVEFINESTYATGNLQIQYEYDRVNKGRPDNNWFELSNLNYNDQVRIDIPQITNQISLKQLNKLRIRFFNGNEGLAPNSVQFIINDTIVLNDSSSTIISGPSTGYGYGYSGPVIGTGDQIVEFSVDNITLTDIPIEKISLIFNALSPDVYIGEFEVLATAIPINDNLQVLLDDEIIYQSNTPLSSGSDKYEIRLEKEQVDIWCNNKFIFNTSITMFDQNQIYRFVGASSRTTSDVIKGSFQQMIDKKYYNENPLSINLIGRFLMVETNLKEA